MTLLPITIGVLFVAFLAEGVAVLDMSRMLQDAHAREKEWASTAKLAVGAAQSCGLAFDSAQSANRKLQHDTTEE